jgi:hypothetical protein
MTTSYRRPEDDDLDAALDEADRLRIQVSTLLATHRQLSTLLVAADTRSGELLKLLVTVRAMIEARNSTAALDSLQDILVNVIGSDDFIIYSIDPRDRTLVPIAGTGASSLTWSRVSLDESWLGDVVRGGSLFMGRERVLADEDRPSDVAAVVPLKVLDRVVGAIVIARLFPHRELLGACDREILGLLGVYAATVIIAADRRARWRQLPNALR